MLHVARHNLESNFKQPEDLRRVRLAELEWGNETDARATSPPFDIVLGSDILYNSKSYGALAVTIRALSGPMTVTLWPPRETGISPNPSSPAPVSVLLECISQCGDGASSTTVPPWY